VSLEPLYFAPTADNYHEIPASSFYLGNRSVFTMGYNKSIAADPWHGFLPYHFTSLLDIQLRYYYIIIIMHTSITASVIYASLLWTSQAHMEMSNPLPIRSSFDPSVSEPMMDYNLKSPLNPDGSNFPCHGFVYSESCGMPLKLTIPQISKRATHRVESNLCCWQTI
jgi:hypothetical protein